MRPKERIPIFIKHINIRKLIVDWFANEKIPCFSMNNAIKEITTKILYLTQYWNDNPDQRFSQVLVNTGVLPNIPGNWYYDEDTTLLIEQGCEPRKVMLWGTRFKKNGELRSKPRWDPIKDLSSSHIEAILNDVKIGKYNLPDKYLSVFRNELVYRAQQCLKRKEITKSIIKNTKSF